MTAHPTMIRSMNSVLHTRVQTKKKRKEFIATGGYTITNDLEDTDKEALTMTAVRMALPSRGV